MWLFEKQWQVNKRKGSFDCKCFPFWNWVYFYEKYVLPPHFQTIFGKTNITIKVERKTSYSSKFRHNMKNKTELNWSNGNKVE